MDGNEEKYVLDCLRTNWISSSGKYISAFEGAFSSACQVRHGVACSSGTTALHLALEALGIGPGDEVIIPDFTLIVSANTVIWTGARPVLVDVDPRTWCMDTGQVEARITERTRAIMPVHMYGHPCNMGAIMDLAEEHDLSVIEDGAEAHGAEYKGRPVGGIGHVGAFSFYGNKILMTGEGGMCVTDDDDLAQRMQLLRSQAFEEPRFVHSKMGFNYRLTNLQAAIGLAQTERMGPKVERKREIARMYNDLLAGQRGLTLPVEELWAKNVYWMYGVVLGDEFGRGKEDVMARLAKVGIETRSFFCGMHEQPLFQKTADPRFPDVSGDYPVSRHLWRRGLYLPSGLALTHDQIHEVVDQLIACRV